MPQRLRCSGSAIRIHRQERREKVEKCIVGALQAQAEGRASGLYEAACEKIQWGVHEEVSLHYGLHHVSLHKVGAFWPLKDDALCTEVLDRVAATIEHVRRELSEEGLQERGQSHSCRRGTDGSFWRGSHLNSGQHHLHRVIRKEHLARVELEENAAKRPAVRRGGKGRLVRQASLRAEQAPTHQTSILGP